MTSPKGRLLVIDDEQGIRDGCRRVLQPEGFQVETAGTIAAGRALIEGGEFDLVLLDVMMPDGKGIDLLETIQRRDPDMVAAIITGYATVELAVEALKEGAYDFISKPFSGDLLLLTVERGLEKRRLAKEARRVEEVEAHAAELGRAKEEMERLDRFKSAFMLTVAHELRAPVVGAQSLLRTMLRGLAGEVNPQQTEILARVEVRHQELLELINDLLLLAESKTAGQERPLTPVDLEPALAAVVDRFRPQAEAGGIALSLEAGSEPLNVEATTDGLAVVFGNLVGNAVKYTPAGGRVTVRAGRDSDRVAVAVGDSGIGIGEDDRLRLGEEFFRASNAKASGIGGTGLGLAIVRQHLDRWRARLEVESEVGKGSTFRVVFPAKT
ncbi:MAG TPA: hybrid sensor histidine kinase/response regulator [Anaerolineales bacterium]|nr:hybrid sensor histidine kinase/response regulator [Anaerolineales bacterium]